MPLVHAPRQAARPDVEGRDADRPVPHLLAAGQRARPRALRRGAEVTLEALSEKGLIRNTRMDVKILGHGELTKKLTVTAHAFSASAREKIEAAGGSDHLLRERAEARRSGSAEEAAPSTKQPEAETRRGADAEVEEPPTDERRRRRGRELDVLLARQRLARPRASAPRPLHRGDPRGLPPRLVDPGAGRRLRPDQGLLRRPRAAPSSACSTCSPAARCRSSRSSRSGSCRTSRRRSSCSS